MDVIPDAKKWLKEMGYDRNVDDIDFKTMITPATTPIWMQLLKNVRPKQEIDSIRRNIIVNRLSSKRSLPQQTAKIVKVHPLKELAIYDKKRELENQLELMKHRVKGNEEQLQELMRQNRIKYITVNTLRHRIESNERFNFLLRAKSKQLKNEINKLKEMEETATPVEEVSATDEKEILETLKRCAKKLEMQVRHQKRSDENSAIFRQNSGIGFPANSTLVLMSAKKEVPNTLGYLPNLGETLTNNQSFLIRNVGLSPNLGETMLNDQSFLMRNVSFSNINISFNGSTTVKDALKELMKSHNRPLIWNCLQQLFDEYKTTLSNACIQKNEKTTEKGSKDLSLLKMYNIHVRYELLAKKCENNIKSLEGEIAKYKNVVLAVVNHSAQAKHALNLRLKDASLTAALKFMQEELSKESSLATNENELQLLNEKIHSVKQITRNTLWEIEQYLSYFKKTNEKLLLRREYILSEFHKLDLFKENFDWMQPLTDNCYFQEIEDFSNFFTKRNRTLQCNSGLFVRDFYISNAHNGDIDEDSLYRFVSLIHRPFCFPENVLFEMTETKANVEEFEKMKFKVQNLGSVPKYTLQELKRREDYIEKALLKFDRLIQKDGNKMTQRLKRLVEVINIWMEMPFGKYMSKHRLVNQDSFELYEKQYNYYYKQLGNI